MALRRSELQGRDLPDDPATHKSPLSASNHPLTGNPPPPPVSQRASGCPGRTGVDFTRVQVVSANNDGRKRRDRINNEELLPASYVAAKGVKW